MFCKTSFFRVTAALGLALAAGVCPVSGADVKTLHGHVPAIVSKLAALGELPATNELRLALGLPLRNPAGLKIFLADIYNPASPNYRRYLAPEQFTAKFGPTEADYAAVKKFAQANGFRIAATHGNRLLLDVSAKPADIERAFHFHLHRFQHPTEAREFFAPDAEPTVEATLPVADVGGLSNYQLPHPKLSKKTSVNNAVPKTGSAPGGDFMGDDFRAAYVPDTTLTGVGQTVGLLQFDGFYSNDIVAYAKLAGGGRTNIQIKTVLLGGFNGKPTPGTNSSNIEVALDIEMAMAMAPGLSKIIVFEAGPNGLPNDILNAMAASNTVKNLSCSWGWGGGPDATTDAIFQQLAAQGQSFYNASGDSDAFTTGATSVNGVDNRNNADAPSSSPYITQVGGTTLTTTGPGGAWQSESVWNWNNSIQPGTGSSGGISSYYAIPDWQSGVSMAGNQGSTTKRNIPDVALAADNVYCAYNNGGSDALGGTSCAAPLWAGLTALINQRAARLGNPPIGFINPAVYEIGGGSSTNCSYGDGFHDITTGDNTWSGSTTNFYAVSGYDLCTGWGTPMGTNLISALAGLPDALVVAPDSDLTASGLAGGPFTGGSQIFEVANSGASGLNWSLINTSSWLQVSTTGGWLAAGDRTNVTFDFAPAANTFPPGIYVATILFSNAATLIAQPRNLMLQVRPVVSVVSANPLNVTGAVGGPFNPSPSVITLTNAGNGPQSWAWFNTNAAPWISVSPASGTLDPHTGVSLNVIVTPAANKLALGNYSTVLKFTNLNAVALQSVAFQLQVLPVLSLLPTAGFVASGPVGGPFFPPAQDYAIVNLGGTSAVWKVVKSSAWLAVNQATGTVAAASQSTFTISLADKANTLAAGIYKTTVKVMNGKNQVVQSLPFTVSIGQNLVANGGFEKGSFSKWTLNANAQWTRVGSRSGLVHSGNYGAILGQLDTLGYLSQVLPTHAGQTYQLSLWLHNPTNSIGATPNEFQVQWEGTMLYDQVDMPFGKWTNLQFTVTATMDGSQLQFGFQDDPYYLGLDDVSVKPIVAPHVKAIAQNSLPVPAAFHFDFAVTAGSIYQAQYKTNLAQPDWIDLGAPVTADADTFTLTDTNTALFAQKFYRLILIQQ